MQTQSNNRRALEHSIRPKSTKTPGGQGEQSPRNFLYARLMQVAIQHTYYNGSNDACPDFTIIPTPYTQKLMTSLGLLFKSEATGFSILYNRKSEDSLLRYLKRQGEQNLPMPGQVWTRLSFVLCSNNPYFLNFTALPFNLDPSVSNLYFTNQLAHKAGSQIILNPGDYVTGQELLDVIPPQYPVQVTYVIDEVRVQSISGEILIREKRCPPREPASDEKLALTSGDGHSEPLEPGCRDTIYLDFSELPEDKYVIEEITYLDELVSGREVLYTVSSPVPLCFIDLLLTDPTGADDGFYPVKNLSPGPGEISTVEYQLRFNTRSIFWTYYIVPQPQRESFEDLRIETLPAATSKQITFAGPCCVHLSNGAKAYRFISEQALPFQQKPEYRFRLLGRNNLMQHDGVLVESLPMASRQQLLQDEVTVLLDVDSSLCPRGKNKQCRRLIRRLGKCLCKGTTLAQELEELRRLVAAHDLDGLQQLRQRCLNLYSDTYVYV